MSGALAAAPAVPGALDAECRRQLEHWKLAAERLSDLDALAPRAAWEALEAYVGVALRQALVSSTKRLCGAVVRLEARLNAPGGGDVGRLRDDFLSLRRSFLRTETTLDFFADALATRANPRVAPLLRACDHIATRSMAEALAPLGRQVPAALTYLDRGLGASILKAGLRLWDGSTENPVAAIKAVRHNLLRPTALIHEAGHQVAHVLGWNAELRGALKAAVARVAPPVADLWAGWSSEIAGDAFAFVHTGYAQLAALADVVDGDDSTVFMLVPDDPHPVAWLRVLLGAEMCRRSYGRGPWERLAEAWRATHPLERASAEVRPMLEASVRALPAVVEATIHAPYRAFGGQPLARLVDPQRVSPAALERLEREAGAAAWSSPYWTWNEAIRLLALTGWRAGNAPGDVRAALEAQERFMTRLGTLRQAA